MHTPPPVFVPFRDADLAYTINSRQAWAERIHAQAGLPAECLSSAGWCLLINQSASAHPWHPDPQKLERCHLVNLVEQDPALGIYTVSTRAIGSSVPASQYVAVCSRAHLRAAAEYLWVHCLGAAIAAHYHGIDKHLFETTAALGLEEQPANHQPPCYSTIRAGALLRFDPLTAPKFHRYFLLDDSGSVAPSTSTLGAGCSLSCLHSEDPLEPIRAIISTDNPWNVERAIKELRRSARHAAPA